MHNFRISTEGIVQSPNDSGIPRADRPKVSESNAVRSFLYFFISLILYFFISLFLYFFISLIKIFLSMSQPQTPRSMREPVKAPKLRASCMYRLLALARRVSASRRSISPPCGWWQSKPYPYLTHTNGGRCVTRRGLWWHVMARDRCDVVQCGDNSALPPTTPIHSHPLPSTPIHSPHSPH